VRISGEEKLHVLMGSIRLQLYEDALPALDWCLSHGLATCVVSDWDCSLPEILEELCPRPFSSVIVSAREGIEKPDPELFLKAAERLSLSPAQIVHIGDEVEKDLQGAKQAGLKPVLIDRGRAHGNIGSLRIENLRDLPTLIEQAFERYGQT
jgi:putative hydrolase of the HAD superfamily